MSARRAVLVISNLEFGGAQRQVVEFANHAGSLGFDVHICSLSDYVPLADQLTDRDRRLHVVQKKWKFDVTVIPRLARLLRELKPDIVHGFLFDAEIAARLAGRRARVPVIIGSERNTDYRLKRRQLIVYRLTRGCVDCVIANSHAGARFNQRMLGHRPEQYHVVHNGVDTQRFQPRDGEAVRQELGLAPHDLVIGMFASFKAQKNHGLAFTAAQRVFTAEPRARLLLVGDELYLGMHGSDEYKKRMDSLVDELGIRSRCLFVGNRSDVERLYCACDVTILPSRFEGTPNVALESMASGVPVIATDVSDNSLIVRDGQTGFIVPLGEDKPLAERVLRLLSDQRLCREMGAEARRWMEQEFSTRRLVEKTTAAYTAALTRRTTRG